MMSRLPNLLKAALTPFFFMKLASFLAMLSDIKFSILYRADNDGYFGVWL